jgi:hypothetical protein
MARAKAKVSGASKVLEVAEKFAAKTSGRRFRRPDVIDIPIEQHDKILGTLRVEPNRIMWGNEETKKWRRVPLDRFIDWINDHALSGSELVEK